VATKQPSKTAKVEASPLSSLPFYKPGMSEDEFLRAASKHADKEKRQHELVKGKERMEREKKIKEQTQQRIDLVRKADPSDIPMSAFMEPPTKPAILEDKNTMVDESAISMFAQNVDKHGKVTMKEKKESETESARRARLRVVQQRLRARRGMNQWMRGGQKGKRPPIVSSASDGKEDVAEILSNPDLQRAHIGRYGLWLVNHLYREKLLYTQPDGWSPPDTFFLLFRFDTSEDVVMQHPSVAVGGTCLDILLILHERRIHMIHSTGVEGFHGAVAKGALEILCTPDNCLQVFKDGTSPESSFKVSDSINASTIPMQTREMFGESGIPCSFVLSSKPLDKFPVDRKVLWLVST